MPTSKLVFTFPGSRIAGLMLLLFLFLAAQQNSCRRQLSDERIQPAVTPRSSDFLLRRLAENRQENIRTLSAHAKIYAESDGMAVEAQANLIWIRDSVLWLNVKKLGVEAARALISRDSVIILNRLDNTYVQSDFTTLQHNYSLPDGFPFLQDLLLSAAWFSPDLSLEADIRDSLHRLSGSNPLFSAEYRIEEGAFVLRQETFIQPRDSRILTLQYGEFKKLNGAGLFPYIRRIQVFSPESGALRLDIEFTAIEVNVPKSYRFEIPAHYERID